MTGNQNYVSVYTGSGSDTSAAPVADQFCAQYGKTARYNRKDDWRFIYDCI